MVKPIIFITTATTFLMAVSALKGSSVNGLQSLVLRDNNQNKELDSLKPGHVFSKKTKEETELRDKLLEYVRNDEEAAFTELNKLRKDRKILAEAHLKKVQKRSNSESKLLKTEHKLNKRSKKEETEMREKLERFVKNDPIQALKTLQKLKKDNAEKQGSKSKQLKKREVFEKVSLRPSQNTRNEMARNTKMIANTAEHKVTNHGFKMDKSNFELPSSYNGNYIYYRNTVPDRSIQKSQELKEDLIIDKIFDVVHSRLPEIEKDLAKKIHSKIKDLKLVSPLINHIDEDIHKVSRLIGAIKTEANKVRVFNSAVDAFIDVIIPTEPPSTDRRHE